MLRAIRATSLSQRFYDEQQPTGRHPQHGGEEPHEEPSASWHGSHRPSWVLFYTAPIETTTVYWTIDELGGSSVEGERDYEDFNQDQGHISIRSEL
ncbi:hypothetical protein DTO271D3_2337 [Paecilomyces variotii]|nr:hypothetical protein DTO271D3_2337 [Paecilomyces variotii]